MVTALTPWTIERVWSPDVDDMPISAALQLRVAALVQREVEQRLASHLGIQGGSTFLVTDPRGPAGAMFSVFVREPWA